MSTCALYRPSWLPRAWSVTFRELVSMLSQVNQLAPLPPGAAHAYLWLNLQSSISWISGKSLSPKAAMTCLLFKAHTMVAVLLQGTRWVGELISFSSWWPSWISFLPNPHFPYNLSHFSLLKASLGMLAFKLPFCNLSSLLKFDVCSRQSLTYRVCLFSKYGKWIELASTKDTLLYSLYMNCREIISTILNKNLQPRRPLEIN